MNSSLGGGNIAVGEGAGSALTLGSDNIEIGNPGGSGGESNTIRIGNTGGGHLQIATFIAGISGTAVAGAAVTVNNSGKLGVAPSSQRFKTEIKPMDKASETLFALQTRYVPIQEGHRPQQEIRS